MSSASPGKKRAGGRPTNEEAVVRKEKLLDVAQKEFLSRGFTETSVDDIARRSGVSKATIYSHFSTKENLFEIASLRSIRDLRRTFRSVPHEGRASEEVLYEYAQVIYAGASLRESMDTMRLAVAEAKQFPNVSQGIWHRRYETLAPLVEYIERLIADGSIRPDEPYEYAFCFSNLVSGHIGILIDGPIRDRDKLEEHLRRSVEIFLNGVRTR